MVGGRRVIANVGSPAAAERRIHTIAWRLADGVTAGDDTARRRIAQLAAAREHRLVETPRFVTDTIAMAPAFEVATADPDRGWESLLIYLFKGGVVVVIDCDLQREFDRDAALRKQQSRLAACAGVVKSLEWATS